MDKPHQQVITTYPVAVRFGQERIHVQNTIPWHFHCVDTKCPQCEVEFVADSGFAVSDLIQALEKDHAENREHPDYIPSRTCIYAC